MTVVYQSATELQRSASAATTTFAHSAGPGVSGVLVGFVRGGTANVISSVSYGGTTLVKVNEANDTATEPGSAEWWFAPHTASGSQNVAYNCGVVASNVHVVAITVAADGTPWVQGQQVKQENTTSHSVSLTTGYVSGMAFGAFYGGAAAPTSLSYATDRVLIHDWDFGAFYSEFFRQASATSPGVASPMGFGGNCPTSDDLAFAAVYITDGGIAAGSPQTAPVTMAGQVPTVILPGVEATATPLVGSFAINSTGQAGPILESGPGSLNTHVHLLYTERKIDPQVGLSLVEGRLPTVQGEAGAEATALPIVGLVAIEGRGPSLYLERVISPVAGSSVLEGRGPSALGQNQIGPTQAQASIAGQVPSVYRELKTSGTAGLITVQGHQVSLWLERKIEPTVGFASLEGRGPAVLGENELSPVLGSFTFQGLAPSTYLERIIAPDSGLVATEGRVPGLQKTFPAGETVLEPLNGLVSFSGNAPSLVYDRAVSVDVGLITLEGREPTLDQTVATESIRGHAGTRRRGWTPTYEESLTATVSVPEIALVPEPIAYFDPPADRLAGMDTSLARIEEGVILLDAKEALKRRRRREEEEIIQFLMRVA